MIRAYILAWLDRWGVYFIGAFIAVALIAFGWMVTRAPDPKPHDIDPDAILKPAPSAVHPRDLPLREQ